MAAGWEMVPTDNRDSTRAETGISTHSACLPRSLTLGSPVFCNRRQEALERADFCSTRPRGTRLHFLLPPALFYPPQNHKHLCRTLASLCSLVAVPLAFSSPVLGTNGCLSPPDFCRLRSPCHLGRSFHYRRMKWREGRGSDVWESQAGTTPDLI